jgi:uncharacterized protein YdeI (YjbR/CyaY-like superfamily)
MVQVTETVYVASRAEWRAWLARNHDKKTEIWLIYPKKNSGLPRVAYRDAVEEALCFGWIDGIVKPIDETRYTQRFTPRKPKSNWSELNRRLYARLLAEGKIAPPGLAKPPEGERYISAPHEVGDEVPPFIVAGLKKHPAARKFFEALAPSHRRHYIAWITNARRDETRQRRLAEAIEHLARGETRNDWLRKK